MTRRAFITLLGGAAVAWPLAARAQQPAMPVIGSSVAGRQLIPRSTLPRFRQALGEVGYVERQNVVIVYRWAEAEAAC
jgi:putative tryptophan/tyrosine transport system substrate-binding protein